MVDQDHPDLAERVVPLPVGETAPQRGGKPRVEKLHWTISSGTAHIILSANALHGLYAVDLMYNRSEPLRRTAPERGGREQEP
jgi:hypothetical protein